MNLTDTLLLGVNTTIVCMVIVFAVLIVLAVIIVLQSKILNLLLKQEKKKDEVEVKKPEVEVKQHDVERYHKKSGLVKGEARIVGLEDEESTAVIIAAVSNASNIPITALRIKSIKRIDSTVKPVKG